MSALWDAFALITEDSPPFAQSEECVRERAYASIALYEQNGRQGAAPFCAQAMACGAKKLYVPSLDVTDKALDELIAYTLENDVWLWVRCSPTLEDAGKIDSRFGKSAVMLLHECGLLERATVVGGAYLDKDDLSLMAQESVTLVLLPSFDAGYGNGIPPVCAALDKGVRVRLGSGDGVYNPARDMEGEKKLLRLLASAQMNKRDAVSEEAAEEMILMP